MRDILAEAGLKPDANEIAFKGGESGVVEEAPDFFRPIPTWKALDENMITTGYMNGEPLPDWKGYPAYLILPGWKATYWIEQMADISTLNMQQGGCWMDKAYRRPSGAFSFIDGFITQGHGQENAHLGDGRECTHHESEQRTGHCR